MRKAAGGSSAGMRAASSPYLRHSLASLDLGFLEVIGLPDGADFYGDAGAAEFASEVGAPEGVFRVEGDGLSIDFWEGEGGGVAWIVAGEMDVSGGDAASDIDALRGDGEGGGKDGFLEFPEIPVGGEIAGDHDDAGGGDVADEGFGNGDIGGCIPQVAAIGEVDGGVGPFLFHEDPVVTLDHVHAFSYETDADPACAVGAELVFVREDALDEEDVLVLDAPERVLLPPAAVALLELGIDGAEILVLEDDSAPAFLPGDAGVAVGAIRAGE